MFVLQLGNCLPVGKHLQSSLKGQHSHYVYFQKFIEDSPF